MYFHLIHSHYSYTHFMDVWIFCFLTTQHLVYCLTISKGKINLKTIAVVEEENYDLESQQCSNKEQEFVK